MTTSLQLSLSPVVRSCKTSVAWLLPDRSLRSDAIPLPSVVFEKASLSPSLVSIIRILGSRGPLASYISSHQQGGINTTFVRDLGASSHDSIFSDSKSGSSSKYSRQNFSSAMQLGAPGSSRSNLISSSTIVSVWLSLSMGRPVSTPFGISLRTGWAHFKLPPAGKKLTPSTGAVFDLWATVRALGAEILQNRSSRLIFCSLSAASSLSASLPTFMLLLFSCSICLAALFASNLSVAFFISLTRLHFSQVQEFPSHLCCFLYSVVDLVSAFQWRDFSGRLSFSCSGVLMLSFRCSVTVSVGLTLIILFVLPKLFVAATADSLDNSARSFWRLAKHDDLHGSWTVIAAIPSTEQGSSIESKTLCCAFLVSGDNFLLVEICMLPLLPKSLWSIEECPLWFHKLGNMLQAFALLDYLLHASLIKFCLIVRRAFESRD